MLYRLAQFLAALMPKLEAQRGGRLVISLQLLLRLSQLPQLAAGAAEGHGGTRIEHVAQMVEDDALRVTVERRERHPASASRRARCVSLLSAKGEI